MISRGRRINTREGIQSCKPITRPVGSPCAVARGGPGEPAVVGETDTILARNDVRWRTDRPLCTIDMVYTSRALNVKSNTERGRAGYDKYRHDFAKLIWAIASPKWNFDDATFDRTAASFENPDHVSIVIHNYRWRLGLAAGESKYDDWEKRIAAGPVIAVPTITLEGDANGAPHYPDASVYRSKFSGKYAHREIAGGIGHNLPQEAPQAFAQAIVDVDGF
jgi:pimeloyl-ACP methyl ester carboxylesterase